MSGMQERGRKEMFGFPSSYDALVKFFKIRPSATVIICVMQTCHKHCFPECADLSAVKGMTVSPTVTVAADKRDVPSIHFTKRTVYFD